MKGDTRMGFGEILAGNFTKFKSYLKSSFSQLNDYDAEDVIQQTALRLLGRDESDIAYASAYIYACLRNVALGLLRKRQRELPEQDIENGSGGSAEDAMLREDLKQQVKDALSMLDEKSRFVFVQTELLGKSYKELSAQTGEPVGTLLSRKSRAVKKLMDLLDDYYYN